MTKSPNTKRVGFQYGTSTQQNTHKKKGRMWVFSADILVSKTKYFAPPMPLDVDTILPVIELWFGMDVRHTLHPVRRRSSV